MTEMNEQGLKTAERLAGWHIGDRSWAYEIIEAYLNHETANARMDEQGIPKRTGVWR